MADQPSIQDPNYVPAMIGHSGTADTAETVRMVVGADGGMSITSLNGSVLTTAVTVGTAGGGSALPATALTNRKAWIGYNSGTVSIFLGGTGVGQDSTGGLPVGTGEYTPSFDLGVAVMYGRTASVNGTMTVLEVV